MKKFILITFIFLTSIVCLFYCYQKNNKELNLDNSNNEVKKEDMEVIKDEPITENDEVNDEIVENNNNNISNNNQNNMESNIVSDSNVVEKNETIDKKVEKTNEEPKRVEQEKSEPVKKEKTIWDDLGISEYDYYNSPMWSWARVDYSVKDYGTYDATHQACIDAGNKLDDVISFSCTNINSYSGAYLGDMLKVKN